MQIRDGLRVRPGPGGRPAHRSARGFGRVRAVRAKAAMLRCCRRSPPISIWPVSTRSTARWRNRGRAKSQLHCSRLARMPGVLPEIQSSGWSCLPATWSAAAAHGTEMDCNQRGARADRALSAPALAPRSPEITSVVRALDGRFVEPGPSGAPTRGRPDVLPTGRNFFSVDSRAVPTAAAWHLGWRSAALLIERYGRSGDWPRTGAFGLGHGQHAHRRRRPRPGARCWALARCGTAPRTGSPASRSCRSACSTAPASMSCCRFPGFSATRSRRRSRCSIARCRKSRRSTSR